MMLRPASVVAHAAAAATRAAASVALPRASATLTSVGVAATRGCTRWMSTAPRPAITTAEVDALVTQHPVVVVHKSYCPFCRDLLERLIDAHISVKEVALDKFENGNVVKDALKERSGQEHVPYIFVGGKLHGGDAMVDALRNPGTAAKAIFEPAGVPCPGAGGYFRN